MASFISMSSPSVFTSSIKHLLSPPPPPPYIPSSTQLKNGWGRRYVLLKLNCLPEPSRDGESDSEKTTSSLSSTSTSTSTSISAYNWCAGLGGLGLLETGYLTFLKLTNSDAFCPIGGGSCGDILNSDYAVVFGVPLPLIGMIAYGLVTALALQLAGNDLPFGIGDSNGRLILLGTTTSMATASAYFLYILSTKFGGSSCSYCLASALLSFSLFFTTMKIMGFEEVRKEVGLQLCIVGLVITALSNSYSTSLPGTSSLAETDLPYYTTEITTQSSPLAISLAKHLHSVGAKMYGAFWCSHCQEQKQMFGREAAKLLDYVECFPDGYRKGIKIAKACANAGIEGFPMWVINDQVLSGEQELSELARASGFESSELVQPN